MDDFISKVLVNKAFFDSSAQWFSAPARVIPCFSSALLGRGIGAVKIALRY